MIRIALFMLLVLTGIVGNAQSDGPVAISDTVSQPVYSEFQQLPSSESIFDERVIVGEDTVSIIIPQRNFGRYDRGLFNFLFIPKGQWAFGLTASYGEFSTDDVQILSFLKDFDFKGKLYSIKPSVSYFIGNEQSDSGSWR